MFSAIAKSINFIPTLRDLGFPFSSISSLPYSLVVERINSSKYEYAKGDNTEYEFGNVE